MQRRPEFSFQGSPARGLPPPRAPAPRYGEDEEEVRWLQASRQASPDYGSGTPSPQLWAYHHNPDLQPYPASAGVSPSRAQAIAGYRCEMLDLVRGLPESAYELSLRDIVDHPAARPSSPAPPPPQPDPLLLPSNTAAAAAARQQQHPAAAPAAAQGSGEPAGSATKDAAVAAAAAVEEGKKQSGGSGKKQGRKQRITMRKQRSRSRSLERTVSLDTGLLIKLFMPLSMGGRKKVSPRPSDAAKDKEKKNKQGKKKEAAAAPPPPVVVQDEECWSKSGFSEAGGSSRTSSTGSSSNSNSSVGIIRNGHVNGGGGVNPRAPARSWSRKRTGCYAFFRTNKNKNGVSQD